MRIMHISFECESAFDLWNKTRRLEKDKSYEMTSLHYNREENQKRPWVVVAKKEDFDAV